MEFELTLEQKQFVAQFREYLRKHLTPEIRAEGIRYMNTNKHNDPGVHGRGEYGGPKSKEFIRRMGADGWLGVGWPKEYGGQGRSLWEQHLFFETVWAEEAPFPVLTINSIGPTLMKFGTPEQKAFYLPPILRGESEIAICYTEPEAGTDLFSLKTSAVRDGDEYIINGQKVFTSSGHTCDYLWLAARTDPDPSKKHKGISVFLFSIDTPGISVSPIYTLLGYRVNALYFDNVRIPRTSLVGAENRGAEVINYQLERERVSLVPYSPIIHRIEKSVEWAKNTKVNGVPVIDHPGVRARLAELLAEVEVHKLLVYRVIDNMTKGFPVWAESSTVKVFGSELNIRINNTLMEIMGPYGQLQATDPLAPADGKVEMHYRDDVGQIFLGGAIEVQRDIIAMVGLGMPRSR